VPSTFASDVPDSLDRITLKALAKERDDRYSTAAEFRSDLEAVVRGGTVGAPAVGAAVLAPVPNDATQVMGPPTTATQTLPPSTPPWQTTGIGAVTTTTAMGVEDEDERRRPWLMWVLIAIAVLAVAGIIALLLAQANKNDTPTTVAVPTVVGLTEAAAKQAVEDADLIYQRAEAPSNDVDPGFVISSDPAAGKEVEKESTVTVTISTGPSSVAVPDVSGKSVSDAVKQLTDLGLVVDPNQTQDNNPGFPAGQVTGTNPPKDTKVDAGSPVTLSVSTGNVTVPNVVGQTQADATKLLNDANLQVNTTEVESAQPAGTVVEQDKAPDTLVKQRTVVNLTIAKAMTTAIVPPVAGQTYEQAVQTLAAAGLTHVQRIDETSEKPTNEVLRTDPAAGTEVEFGDQINIHVSKGNQPQGNGTPTSKP
jgi:serine/threonine-protein kinase